MESRINQAIARKQSGQFNCAQAVACTYCDLTGLDEATMYRATGAFGLGMGCTEGTCGSIVGAGVIVGLLNRDRAKAKQVMQRIMTRFKERNGSTVCRSLKGLDTGVALRHCDGCVADASEFLESELPAPADQPA